MFVFTWGDAAARHQNSKPRVASLPRAVALENHLPMVTWEIQAASSGGWQGFDRYKRIPQILVCGSRILIFDCTIGCISGENSSRSHESFYASRGIRYYRSCLDHPRVSSPLAILADAILARTAPYCNLCYDLELCRAP